MVGYGGMEFPCADFLEIREEERKLFTHILEPQPHILDIGCCVGRHLQYIREIRRGANLCGIEREKTLQEYCRKTIQGCRLLDSLDQLRPGETFDVILLLGNGLGLFETEQKTQEGLRQIYELIRPSGHVILEAGNSFGTGYCTITHKIYYAGVWDEPFLWGYADEPWVRDALKNVGFVNARILPSRQPGSFFICHATKP
jgi:SAM-dependent methyltransferase